MVQRCWFVLITCLMMACIAPLTHAKGPGYWAIISTGKASYYNDRFQGKKTANGERYDKHALTAANRSLPMGTVVRITNLKNGRHLLVRINDRGPTKRDFIVDVSREAAKRLHMLRSGVVPVQMEIVTDKRGVPIHAKEAFYVQLAEASTLKGAEARLKTLASNNTSKKMSEKSSSKHKKMDIFVAPGTKGKRYVVGIGPYPTYQKAMRAFERLGKNQTPEATVACLSVQPALQ